MTVTALVLQTWFDIAIQHTGSVMNAYAIATANERGITDDIETGEIILIPEGISISKKELQYLASKKAIPATAMKKPPIPPGLGIGYMRIGINFKVG
jgi:hypothetical protein